MSILKNKVKIENDVKYLYKPKKKNKDELTIITIKNEGDINFPLISKDENMDKAIPTNDYFGKEKATHRYELDTFLKMTRKDILKEYILKKQSVISVEVK